MRLTLLGWMIWLAGVAVYAALKRPRRAPLKKADVLVLRPCAGSEPLLARALASSPPRTIFLLASEDDAALPAARAHGEVLFTGARAPNRKVDQLRAALERAPRAAIVVVADSDVELDVSTLDALVSPIARGEADATWAPHVEIAPETLGDRASAAALSASLHAFVALASLDPRGFVGKLFAIRASALERVGGFAPLTRVLGEDVELARRLREAGLRVRASSVVARSLARGRTVGQAIDRYARWIMVVRAQRAALLLSYPLLFLAAPIAACAAIATRDAPLLLAALTARALSAIVARARSGRPFAGLMVDALLSDALLAAAFVRALVTRSVVWRGARFRVGARGELKEEAPSARATRGRSSRSETTGAPEPG